MSRNRGHALVSRKRPEVANFHDKQITWVRRLASRVMDCDGPGEVVHLAQVNVADVGRVVVVVDLPARPVQRLNAEEVACEHAA
jgi:hypothetical protein